MGPPSLPVWEYGPGEGWLAFDILESARSSQALLHQAIAYTFAEQSPQASARIREKFPESDNIRFADASLYPPAGFEGVVLAHEFLDALPVHRPHPERAGYRREVRGEERRGDSSFAKVLPQMSA